MSTDLVKQLNQMREYFNTGATRSYAFRKKQLEVLKQAVQDHEEEIYAALFTDLKKSKEECWVTENGFFMAEMSAMLNNLKSWMEPESVSTNMLNLPSSSRIEKDPMGVVLIIGPWNYPFQLLFAPLIGAIAAGNAVVLKPSEFAPATAVLMQKIIESVFPKEYILYVPGDGATVIPEMMQHFRFDHVFYTGSTTVGKIIYKMAAEELVPVTLELGGKSPCVVETDANIKIAAKRIVMTKFSNAGQMCVAPDYVLVHVSKKEALVKAMRETIDQFFGAKAEDCENFGKIINHKQFDRLVTYLNDGSIIQGGRTDRDKLFIEPTLLENVSTDSKVMKDEIFGPILPILTFQTMEEAKAIIAKNPNPLAFYVFTESSTIEQAWLDAVPSGGACVNNASWHLTNHKLPFGGRGYSGMGAYHGHTSIETFSHRKSVLKTPTWFDPAMKYPPFNGKLGMFKLVIR
ncbi:MAG: aldehyde dehydrogenase [Bacteroidetes bacterium]|nr:aldehyde dehydrogenase [Bacteroidota bacterium]